MITSVSGTVARIGVDHAVVEVGGVGLAVLCTPHALANLRTGSPGRLATSLIVREDSLTLYGFADDEERDLFELLQTANGVGPKVARAILAVLSPDEIRRAVSTGDHKTLTRAPGLGPKGAEKLVVELRDRIGAFTTSSANGVPVAGRQSEASWRTQVRAGLGSLGFTGKDVDGALDAVTPADGSAPEVSTALRGAIQRLGRK
ncbi:Holliday junction branch migration protein RuvA [Fodinicola feengrottensis]|uniref:Holliday junction branch migration complex subunit RuvA n=1 Tax=Fodinicola feengrottensis TaxID=435914 RepID=A0ABN2G483_9ACTN